MMQTSSRTKRSTSEVRRNRHSLSKKDVLISTPKSYSRSLKARKTPKTKSHVSFRDSSRNDRRTGVTDEHRKSLLGYDWIAGILDNTSYLSDKSDDFFEDLKEFRRVNNEDCYGRPSAEKLTSVQVTPHRKHEDIWQDANTVLCENTYTLNERLFPVAIHGPDAPCTVCKTKREPGYEREGSYVRVSVPRSSLQSPYKVRPHRRVSFDPTDTVGLSAHCLAGWESSKPAVIPAPTSLDLKASTSYPNASNTVRMCQSQSTSDLLDRSLSVNYGLQVLERQRRGVEQPGQPLPYTHGSPTWDTTS